MTRHRQLMSGMAVAAIGLTAAGAAVSTGSAHSGVEPVRCEIQASTRAGMTSLTGMVKADAVHTGIYRFDVKSSGRSGSSNISQSGEFEAGPGEDAEVGNVMLSSPGAIFDARLELEVRGKTIVCDKRFGAI
ncbi:curli-like amyloid fiber formation chaperone CsgH [Oricola cellulosilytica]|uniref:CsgH-like domain-containing protein n=1 Tax=Oricola cellulosilytica TaxID=1429082 RepID=A0A4R0PD63_9HYPH|nr:curli-like amyloid fiber formation chaperone CsgH [Oricola cellulosilytica]TCD14259.1 hypothetical protein E0D97_09260 [Oricola cellulosilytica]